MPIRMRMQKRFWVESEIQSARNGKEFDLGALAE